MIHCLKASLNRTCLEITNHPWFIISKLHSIGRAWLCLVCFVTRALASLCIFIMGTSILDFWQGEVWRTLALLVATVALVAVSHSVWVMVTRHWWMPRRLGHIMKQQGWKGPPFCLGVGSLPEVVEFVNKQGSSPLAIRNFDTVPTIIPQYALFSKRYGTKL
jgi:hypothetical protein